MVIAAIAAVGSLALGYSNTKKAQDSQRKRDKRVRKTGGVWRDLVNRGAPRIEARLQEQRDYLEGSFDKSQALVSGVADANRRRVMERERSTLGAITGSQQNRGLSNSSILDQARRSVRYDTERSFMDLDSQLAGLRASIEQRRAGAVGGVIGSQAAYERQNTQDLADVERSFLSYEGNQVTAAPQGTDLSGLASLASVFTQ